MHEASDPEKFNYQHRYFPFLLYSESSDIRGEITTGNPIAQYSPSFIEVQYLFVGTGFTGLIAKSPRTDNGVFHHEKQTC